MFGDVFTTILQVFSWQLTTAAKRPVTSEGALQNRTSERGMGVEEEEEEEK